MALGAGLPHTHHRVTLGRSLPLCALLSSPVNRDDDAPFLGRPRELVDGVLSIAPGPDWVPNSVILHTQENRDCGTPGPAPLCGEVLYHCSAKN